MTDHTHPDLYQELAQLDEQIEQFASDERSSDKVVLLERAVKIAEQLQDKDLIFKYYQDVISALYYSADWDLLFIYFPKLIKYFDDHGQELDFFKKLLILFKYKWFINHALDNPQIPLSRIEALCDDLEKRIYEVGQSPRPIHFFRQRLCEIRDDQVGALEYLNLANQSYRDWLSDCAACEESSLLESYFYLDQVEQGFELFQSILDRNLQCDSVPFTSYESVARHYLMCGDHERAHQLYQEGWILISKLARKNMSVFDRHIAYFAYQGDFEMVLKELQIRIFEVWSETNVPYQRMISSAFMTYTLTQLHTQEITHVITNRVQHPDFVWTEGGLELKSAIQVFTQEALKIAQQFDQRNENTSQSRYVEEVIKGKKFPQSS